MKKILSLACVLCVMFSCLGANISGSHPELTEAASNDIPITRLPESPEPVITATPEPSPSLSPTPIPEPSPRAIWKVPDLENPDTVLPIKVVYYEDLHEIWKTYEIAPDKSPSHIPSDSFERGDYLFECVEILKQEMRYGDSKQITETRTANSPKKDIDSVMNVLPETVEAETEDGYTGTLTLDTSTIKTDVAGYGSSSNAVSTTRTYPNLASSDTSSIPKTVQENGMTYQFASVDWSSGTVEIVDDVELPVSYTAKVTYTGTATSSYVTGYTVTADYTGEVYMEGVYGDRYTVIFAGAKIPEPTPSPTPKPTPKPTSKPEVTTEPEQKSESATNKALSLIVLLALIAAAVALIIILIIFITKKRKESKLYEEETYHSYTDSCSVDRNDHPRNGC